MRRLLGRGKEWEDVYLEFTCGGKWTFLRAFPCFDAVEYDVDLTQK